jgi:hypothetical protein
LDVERCRYLYAGGLIMGVFTDIEMVWAGNVYTIKSTRVMGAIAQIEDVLTFSEIAAFMRRETIPMARLCQAYAVALKYAGAKVTGEMIYQAVYAETEKQMVVLKAITGLLALALPPDQRDLLELAMLAAEAGEETDGEAGAAVEADPGNSQAAAAAS